MRIIFKKNFLLKILSLILLVVVFLLLGFSLFAENFNLIKTIIFFSILIILIVDFLNLFIFISEDRDKKEENIFDLQRKLLDSLTEGLVAYDDSFKIIFVNRAFSNLVGLSSEHLIGLTVVQAMIRNEKYRKLANIFFPFLEGEEIKIVSKEPEIIEVKFRFPEERYFLISYIDLVKEAKFKLRLVFDRTQDVLDNRRRTEFFQFLSHSILTPLNEIKWLLESFNTKNFDAENKEVYDSALDILKNSIIFFEMIISSLKMESEQLTLNLDKIDINQVIINVVDILKEQIRLKNLKVTIEVNEQIKTLPADPSLSLLTFYSLIENAVIYNKEGGSIKIGVEKMSSQPYVSITIEDTGIGMSEEELSSLFQKYYRGSRAIDKKPKGFGIGLYMAKNIIKLHGGDIKIQSQLDKGTKITILWPTKINV
ncbi:MAG: HAMP domain-containing histidine kinase [Patescibacteria group bacterium]|nr:HAMP domain-containing histidine kinase [Patescibacteria group bacterium]